MQVQTQPRRTMPMDAYRTETQLVVNLDLPGIAADTLAVTVEKNVLTVKAQRPRPESDGIRWIASERPYGTHTCQLVLAEGLELDSLAARYHDGVLTVTIPVAEQAKARTIEIALGGNAETAAAIETPKAA
jgi:HSP20 family protein